MLVQKLVPDYMELMWLLLCSGHGDKNSCSTPRLVKDIGEVGQVACGSVHTVALSQDGKTVWSFGSGDNGTVETLTSVCVWRGGDVFTLNYEEYGF